MAGSVYRVTELVGVSERIVGGSCPQRRSRPRRRPVRDLRVGEAHRFDVTIAGRQGVELPVYGLNVSVQSTNRATELQWLRWEPGVEDLGLVVGSESAM